MLVHSPLLHAWIAQDAIPQWLYLQTKYLARVLIEMNYFSPSQNTTTMKHALLTSLLFCAIILSTHAQSVYAVDYESQADVTVYVVDYESQADLSVYWVDYESQADDDGLWYMTDYESQADVSIYFVDYESQADLTIYYVDYESQAGWNGSNKSHLFR